MSCGLRKQARGGGEHSGYVDRKNSHSFQFSRMRMQPTMSDPNGTKFTMKVPSTQGRPHSKFEENLQPFPRYKLSNIQKKFLVFFFLAHCKNCYISRMCASIWLNFGKMYWESKGKYQYQICGKSDQQFYA